MKHMNLAEHWNKVVLLLICGLILLVCATALAEENNMTGSLTLSIDGQTLPVVWEDNASVEALKAMASEGTLTVQMSMYGGFEQVGPLGASLPREDVQTQTTAGDIVLYSGNQIVIFYGSNSWAYTRLGRVDGVTAEQMRTILGSHDVTLTLSMDSSRTLVVVFSCTGNTRTLAEYAAEILSADLYEIEAEQPYTEADLAYYTGGRCDREQDDPSVRPAIANLPESISQYDTIIIGHPIWHGQAPMIIRTFLESYDFSGKTLVTFCTSASSALGSSAKNLYPLVPDSVTWLESRRFPAGATKDDIAAWLNSIGLGTD